MIKNSLTLSQHLLDTNNFDPEDGSSIFLQQVGINLQNKVSIPGSKKS
jgi:hypothetical protein